LAARDTPKAGQRARLGIVMRDVSAERAAGRKIPAEEGVVVTEVMPDSAAVAAGLQRGDVILQVDGRPVTKSDDVIVGVKNAKIDLTLQLLRDGKQMTVRAVLGEATESPSPHSD
jgi:S1-C subfamily serine protease